MAKSVFCRVTGHLVMSSLCSCPSLYSFCCQVLMCFTKVLPKMSGSFLSPISPPEPGATQTSPVIVSILTMPPLYLLSKILMSSSLTLLFKASVLSSFLEQAKAFVMSKYRLR